MKKLKLFLSAIFLTLSFGLAQTGYARTDDYTVKPIIPENQSNKDLGYFDILLSVILFSVWRYDEERITVTGQKRKAHRL